MFRSSNDFSALENQSIVSPAVASWVTWWSSPTTERNDALVRSGSSVRSPLLVFQEDEHTLNDEKTCKRNDSAIETPSYVECPITHQIYRRPVMLVEAEMVVEEAVVENLITCPGGPEIGTKLKSKTYFPDRGTQRAVEAYLTRHPEKDNADDRFPEYPSSQRGNQTVAVDVQEEPAPRDFCYQAFGCSNKWGSVVLFTFIGGLAVGLYYAIMAIPCRHLALKNLTGGPLSFTHSSTIDDDMFSDCVINPWQNVSSNSSVYLSRGSLLTCTFYTESGIELHTSAYKVSTNGYDSNGCQIAVEKASSKCSWTLFKECSYPIEKGVAMHEDVVDASGPYHLRRHI